MFHPSHILKGLVHEHRPAAPAAAGTKPLFTREELHTEEFSVQG